MEIDKLNSYNGTRIPLDSMNLQQVYKYEQYQNNRRYKQPKHKTKKYKVAELMMIEFEEGQKQIKELQNQFKIHIKNDKYTQALAIVDKIIRIEMKRGQQIKVVQQFLVEICKLFNSQAMKMLNQEMYTQSKVILSQLLLIIQGFISAFPFAATELEQMLGLTLNNLSCNFKRNGQVEEAEKCLRKALKIQNLASKIDQAVRDSQDIQEVDESAVTELNLCSIFSEKKNHLRAKKHAESAIKKLQSQDQNPENLSLLSIAYFNLGCQQEFLTEFQQALQSYTRGMNLEQQQPEASGSTLLAEFQSCIKQIKQKMKNNNKMSSSSQNFKSEYVQSQSSKIQHQSKLNKMIMYAKMCREENDKPNSNLRRRRQSSEYQSLNKTQQLHDKLSVDKVLPETQKSERFRNKRNTTQQIILTMSPKPQSQYINSQTEQNQTKCPLDQQQVRPTKSLKKRSLRRKLNNKSEPKVPEQTFKPSNTRKTRLRNYRAVYTNYDGNQLKDQFDKTTSQIKDLQKRIFQNNTEASAGIKVKGRSSRPQSANPRTRQLFQHDQNSNFVDSSNILNSWMKQNRPPKSKNLDLQQIQSFNENDRVIKLQKLQNLMTFENIDQAQEIRDYVDDSFQVNIKKRSDLKPQKGIQRPQSASQPIMKQLAPSELIKFETKPAGSIFDESKKESKADIYSIPEAQSPMEFSMIRQNHDQSIDTKHNQNIVTSISDHPNQMSSFSQKYQLLKSKTYMNRQEAAILPSHRNSIRRHRSNPRATSTNDLSQERRVSKKLREMNQQTRQQQNHAIDNIDIAASKNQSRMNQSYKRRLQSFFGNNTKQKQSQTSLRTYREKMKSQSKAAKVRFEDIININVGTEQVQEYKDI